uniref:Uncharacterized protein n=1 Tax=viral metagenome TaxID=1070528 RepID=A0A6C0JY35_9ZZZZ
MFILLFENNKWKIYLSASTTNSKVFVCEFYDGQLAQNKVDTLNDQLNIIRKIDWQDEQ